MPSTVHHMVRPSSIPQSEWTQIEQDLPTQHEPVLYYLANRDSLIELEKQRRSDYTFRLNCSPLAQESCKIVDRIRDEEQRSIWALKAVDTFGQRSESGANVFPGMPFSLAKNRLETTKLWQIIKRMPKGALLHAHLDAMVDLDFLFDILLSTPGMYIHCASALATRIELDTAPVKFRFIKSVDTDADESPSIWTSRYIPDTPLLVTKAADSFPNGGRLAFLAWLRSRCTITEQESIKHYDGVDDIWRKFASVFLILDTILFYEPIFRLCLRRILSELHVDKVRWADLRLAFTFRYYREGCEEPEPNFGHLFFVFNEELENFKASDEGKNFWGCRIIWTGIRKLETRRIIEDMEACIATKIAYPHLISGYDLVGQEDAGRPLRNLLPELFWFREQCTKEDIEIPFFFHAGECLGDGNETDQNLYDAILLGTRRIGHGYSLYKHPLLIDLVKEKKILVESCPISNEVLRLCSSISSHSLPALIACGVPCSLSNDDPTILGQDSIGLTHDFWQAIQGWENLGLAGLASLAENSVRWAAFEDEKLDVWLKGISEDSLGNGTRAMRLKEWHIEWEQFCLWILNEFSQAQPQKDFIDVVTLSDNKAKHS